MAAECTQNALLFALADALLEAAGFAEPTENLNDFITNRTVKLERPPDFITFSGGVADCIWNAPEDLLKYGDIGPLLGKVICEAFETAGASLLRTKETIGATVVGASACATTLSGSTVFFRDVIFPIKNLPVSRPLSTEAIAAEETKDIAGAIRRGVELFADEEGYNPICLSLRGVADPDFETVERLARAIREGLAPLIEQGETTVVALEHDMAKALGQALYPLLPKGKLLCIDGVSVPEGSYMDVMAPAYGGTVLPVVIKTLAFEKGE